MTLLEQARLTGRQTYCQQLQVDRVQSSVRYEYLTKEKKHASIGEYKK